MHRQNQNQHNPDRLEFDRIVITADPVMCNKRKMKSFHGKAGREIHQRISDRQVGFVLCIGCEPGKIVSEDVVL